MKFISNVIKFFGGFVMGFVIIALPFVLLFRSIGNIMFSQEEMVQLVNTNVLNPEVLASLTEPVIQGYQNDPDASFTEKLALLGFQNFENNDWVTFYNLIAPSAVTTQTANDLLSGFYNWIDDDTQDFPQISVDLTAWKGTLATNTVPVSVMILDKMPACSAEQLLDYGLSGEISTENFPLCQPPEPLYSDLLNNLSILVPSVLENFDDVYEFDQQTNLLGQESRTELSQFKSNLRLVRRIANSGWIMLGLIYLVGIVMGARTLPELFRWAGNPLFLTGLLTMGGAIGLLYVGGELSEILRSTVLTMSDGAFSVFDAVVTSTITSVARPLLPQSVVLIVLGVGGLIMSVVAKNYSEKKSGASMTSSEEPAHEPVIIEFPKDDGDDDGEKPSGMFG